MCSPGSCAEVAGAERSRRPTTPQETAHLPRVMAVMLGPKEAAAGNTDSDRQVVSEARAGDGNAQHGRSRRSRHAQSVLLPRNSPSYTHPSPRGPPPRRAVRPAGTPRSPRPPLLAPRADGGLHSGGCSRLLPAPVAQALLPRKNHTHRGSPTERLCAARRVRLSGFREWFDNPDQHSSRIFKHLYENAMSLKRQSHPKE